MCQNVDMTTVAVARANAQRALALYACGNTWPEVAATCGYRSRQAAFAAVQRLEHRRPVVSLEALRRMEDEELRIRRQAFHHEFADARSRKDIEAMAVANRELDRIAQRRARLLGLDMPTRSEVKIEATLTSTAIIQEARRKLLALDDGNTIEGEIVE